MEISDKEWIGFREKCRQIILLSNKSGEKLFDVLLILAIILSLVIVMLDSIEALRVQYSGIFYAIEWFLTILFYRRVYSTVLRCSKRGKIRPKFFWIVD